MIVILNIFFLHFFVLLHFFHYLHFQAPESINVPDSKAADHGKVIHLKWIAFPCSAQARSGEGESEARQLVIPNN